MLSDVVVKNAPPSVSDHEKTIQYAETECWYGEEIHGGDGFTVIAQEGRPVPYRLGISSCCAIWRRWQAWSLNRALYARHNEIERLFRRLKGYCRIFPRFE